MILLCISFSFSTFWTALTAIGTFAMAFVAYRTLCKNDDQVKEMKRQWEEDHRPYINVELLYEHALSSTASRYLKIENYGKGTTRDIKIEFEESFIDSIPIFELKNQLLSKRGKVYTVLPGRFIKESFCDIIDLVQSSKSRIGEEEFELNQRMALIEYLKKPIKVSVVYTWNGYLYQEYINLKYDN